MLSRQINEFSQKGKSKKIELLARPAATCLYLKASGVGADGNEILSTTIMERHTMTRRTRRLAMLFWFIRRK